MAAKLKPSQTPLFVLDAFSQKAKDNSFYIETIKQHLSKHKFVSVPHKHDFYLLLYITEGKGTHSIDFNTYPASAGSFFLMTPGQVHSWTLTPGTDGYIIFFLPAFYKMQAMDNNLIAFPFFHSLNASPLVQLSDDQKRIIDFIIRDMHHEFLAEGPIDIRILRTYLEVILLKLSNNYVVQENHDGNSATFKIRQLEQLIEKNYLKKKQPREYADMMNLSPSYLNTICRQGLNKTLSDLISERIILEAKRLFSYSDLTVSQVSSQLNFSGSSYFIRFFRKHTGTTPEHFKETMNRTA